MTSIHDYSDIIHIERPEPKYHHRMPLADRAAQFAPFAALTGFSEVIDEAGRFTTEKHELDDREKNRINRILNMIQKDIIQEPFVKITFFVQDEKKYGGNYQTISGRVKKIDIYDKNLVLTNGLRIDFDNILEIEKEDII